MPLLLRREEVEPLLTLSKSIELTEEAFRQQAAAEIAARAPYHIGLGGRKALRVVSGALLGWRRAGVRLGPNDALGGDRMHALLYDAETGDLLCIMGYPFGTLRTAATVALAARYMAREDAKRVGLFGVGRNALGLLKGLRLVRDVRRIVVYSRDPERRARFAEKAAGAVGLEVSAAERPEQAVEGMEIVLAATNSPSPVFASEHLAPGAHVSSMGKPSELDRAVFLRAARVVVGSREHERNYHDRSAPLPLLELAAEGRLSWSGIYELGEVVSGRVPGRGAADEINVFRESQGGFGDVAFAAWVYDEARRRGLGQEVRL